MLIITNVTALALDPPSVREHIDVVVKDGRIAAAEAGAAEGLLEDAETVIDGTGKVLISGLVCSHLHCYSAFARGLQAAVGPTPDFISTLKQLWWRLDRSLDEQSIYYSALSYAMDAVRCGTTAVIDHHASPNCIDGSLSAVRRAFETVGVRGMTCYEVTNRNNGAEEEKAGIAENRRFIKEIDDQRRAGTWSGLVEAAVGAHAPFTVDDPALEQLSDLIKTTGRGLHIHAAEDRYDVSVSHHRYGRDIAERLDSFGLLTNKSMIIHGVHLQDHEVDLLNARDAAVVHNPRSNMNNSVGYTPHLPRIANPALGTDGIGANMFEEVKTAFFKHRDAGGPLQPGDFLRILSGGYELLRRYFDLPFGSLQPGDAADLVLCSYRSPTPVADETIAGHLIFAMGSHNVETVIVNGQVVMKDRAFPFDEEEICRKSREAALRTWKKMNTLSAD